MNNTAANVVTLKPQHSVINLGVTAWQSIKTTAEQQRQLWAAVGDALLVGRKLHPSNQGFSKWCREIGFGDMDLVTRSDAMWMAESYRDGKTEVWMPTDLTHPKSIRQWHRENANNAQLPSDLQEITPTASITLDTREPVLITSHFQY